MRENIDLFYNFKSIILTTIIFLILDGGYLYIMRNKFNNLVESIQNSKLKLKITPIVFCYIFLIIIFYYFIIYKNASSLDAFLLGLLTYGVYETTNMAIFNKWNINYVILDTLWGGVLFLLTIFFYNNIINYI